MHDLMEHYDRKMPTDGQIRAQNYFSQNCDSSDPAPVQDAHSWMTSTLSDDVPAPPAASDDAPVEQSEPPAPPHGMTPFERLLGRPVGTGKTRFLTVT